MKLDFDFRLYFINQKFIIFQSSITQFPFNVPLKNQRHNLIRGQKYIFIVQLANKLISKRYLYIYDEFNFLIMKRLLLLIVILFSIASNATQIQIDFVSGFNISVVNSPMGSPSEGTSTTDAAINSILTNYNVNHCINYYSGQYTMLFVDYFGNDVNGFRNALQNNSNVSKTWLCYQNPNGFSFADRLYVYLSNINNGNPISINNGILTTTNTSLNTIFSTYNVKSTGQSLPNTTLSYMIFFDGDITNLKNELDALTTVLDPTNPTNLVGVPMLLKNNEFHKFITKIFPNPFLNNFTIQAEEQISTYSLIDISGKHLINATSKNELDNLTSQLSSGIYFLNLQFENGNTGSVKLVKQ